MIIDFNKTNGGGGGSGSTVSYSPIVSAGTELGRIVIDGASNSIYSPTVDLSNYYTSAQTDSAITAATSAFTTSAQVETQITAATSAFTTSGDFKTINSQSIVGSGNIQAVTSSTITTIWKGSQSDYDNLPSYDNNTFYIIV